MNRRAFHAQRPLVCLALSFALGILIGGYRQGENYLIPALGMTFSLLFLLALIIMRKPLLFGVCFCLLFSGIIRAQHAVNPSLVPEGKYHISARVEGLAERREADGRVKAVLRDLRMIDDQGTVYHGVAAYWTYYLEKEKALPRDGQRVDINASIYHPLGRQNPEGFNFRLYLLQKGITLGVSGARDLQFDPYALSDHQNPWLKARLWLADLYDQTVGEGSELIRALLWGDRSGLNDEVEQDFREAGITHVLSVSGLHVSILASAMLFILSKFGVKPKWRFLIITAVLVLYCRLLDFDAPVLRAAMMSIILLWSRLYFERSDPLTSLSIAMAVVLLLRPLDLFHIGFQLSFLAVLGIFTLGDRLKSLYDRMWKHKRRIGSLDKIVAAMQTTISATVFTVPVIMNTFHRVSLIVLLFSPLACLIVGVLMLYGLALMPIALIWMPLARVLAMPLSWMSLCFTWVTEMVGNLPYASISVTSIGGIGLVLCFLMLMLFTRYVCMKYSFRLMTIFLLAAILIGVNGFIRQSDMRHVRYTLFSSGSADTAVIEDGRSTYVIDAAEHGEDLGSYLLSQGRDIDILFISHLHRDHIGGLRQLMEQKINVKQIVLPAHAKETKRSDDSIDILQIAEHAGIPAIYAAQGDCFEGNRVSFDVLWPVYGKMYPGMDANHNSMALLVDLGGVSLLSSGDLTQEYEMYSAVPAHILKLAHHGAKGSTSPEYLRLVSPQLALLSANSSRMQYASAALTRLNNMGIPVWGTQTGQAIIIRVFSDEKVDIRHYTDRGI